MRFTIFWAWRDEIRFAFDPHSFVDKITVEDPLSDSFRYIFLKRYRTKFEQMFRVWPKELSKRFPQLVISVTEFQNGNQKHFYNI